MPFQKIMSMQSQNLNGNVVKNIYGRLHQLVLEGGPGALNAVVPRRKILRIWRDSQNSEEVNASPINT